MEADDNRRNKYEQNYTRGYYKRLKGLDNCEVFFRSVLEFGMDHINSIKAKELRVLLCYHFDSEKLRGIPKKVEILGAITEFLESIGRLFCRGGVCCNK